VVVPTAVGVLPGAWAEAVAANSPNETLPIASVTAPATYRILGIDAPPVLFIEGSAEPDIAVKV
jgi:hypothetical protein